jgi:hypothetical protein
MHWFGKLMERRGKIKNAESWYRQAAERDDALAISDLNRLLKEHPWLRR